MSQDKYNEGPLRISQSAIKDWRELSPRKWFEKWVIKVTPFRRSDAMDLGNLVDTLCFTPELFEKRFIISEVAKPSDKCVKIVTEVYAHLLELNKNIDKIIIETVDSENKVTITHDHETTKRLIPKRVLSLSDESNIDIVKKFCLENDHYSSKPDQAYNDILKKGSEYFEFLKKAGHKIVITEQQKTLAEELKTILYTNNISSRFFAPKKDCRVIFQQQLFAEYEIEGFENVEFLGVKGIPDIIHINNTRKEIREVDLKVTNNAFLFNSFAGPVKKFNYGLQHSFYDFLIREWIKTFEKGKYKDYHVMSPLNLVIDDDEKLPYLYQYSVNDLIIKRSGIEGTPITGWEHVLREIAYHINENKWDYPIEHLKNGYINISLYNKK